ncbi:Pyruvate decarboxylase [Cladophialophora carrionii]|uniref:Pyruvate decarboxylase n=1 Tax=Cladophialophora carrionii TaxID=86049 RepID=A0A1C1CR35_9EURO|nr:Pyruvate decarboxylase [Cladophialophora carrionii]
MTSSSTVCMGQYLFQRIKQLGTQHILGVPGDFNHAVEATHTDHSVTLLDEIYNVSGLKWIGCCNELNGAYAADGYTRIKGSPAVLVTTYAVGELSAMNGVAGAYAEHAGMIHIVGMPARSMQKARAMLHHTMKANMDHATYIQMAEPIRETHAYLMDDKTMAEEIDRTLIACLRSRLPVYIYVPVDSVSVALDAKRLETPLDTSVQNKDGKTEDQMVSNILSLVEKATSPAILADIIGVRHGGRELIRQLAELTQFPSYSTPLSKGVIDETKPYYNGLYNGKVSFPGVADSIEASDLVLNIGPLPSDSNTGGFTREIKDEHLVWLGHDFCKLQDQTFDGVHFLPVLKKLVAALEADPQKFNLPRPQKAPRVEVPVLLDQKSGQIKQAYVWQRLGRFLRENDILLVESGTAQFGMPDATFPPNVKYITQTFWSSIGFTVGACFGALLAAKEMNHTGRVVLIVGEGSLQMTVQEIGSYIRYGLKPIIFVINNNGYAIERAIHGPEQGYNDVSTMWDYQKMLEFFGARQDLGIKTKSRAARTVEELEAVLNDDEFASGDTYQLCEIVMDTFDYPWRLSEQISVTREKMKRAAAQQTAPTGEA